MVLLLLCHARISIVVIRLFAQHTDFHWALQSALSYTQQKLSSAFSQASSILAGDKKAVPEVEL